MNNQAITSAYFIGVGGVGMSGIALVAHKQGLRVSGSDIRESRYTKELQDEGIEVHIGHDAHNIPDGDHTPDVVVTSTAVLDNNPELCAAKQRGITLWHRAQMLAYVGRGLQTLAVAGTHGKTTTSSMVATALDEMGFDPSFLIGGMVRAYHSNAHYGTGKFYVVEADESDKSFTYLSPHGVIITNVEADHLDHYRDLNEIREKFIAFMGSVPEHDGSLVVWGDDNSLLELAQRTNRAYVTYGEAPSCNFQLTSFHQEGIRSHFTFKTPDGKQIEGTLPQTPGKHNALNALSVIALLSCYGIDPAKTAAVLANFKGVRRRFDVTGIACDVTVIDDYAHHPSEIAATIQAASLLNYKHIHVIFQPHRYSRFGLFAHVLHDSFAHAFDKATSVTFMDVYSAGESPIAGITGKSFMNVVASNENHPQLYYVAHRNDLIASVLQHVEAGDLLITMGAGDVSALGPLIVEELQQRSGTSDTSDVSAASCTLNTSQAPSTSNIPNMVKASNPSSTSV